MSGTKTGITWTVNQKLKVDPNQSPGQFSIGYKATGSNGVTAFLKASDLAHASRSPDPVKALLEATSAHQFERNILEHCQGNRLDKVVTAIDFGVQEVVNDGIRDLVFFIVFELAKGDLRKFVLNETTEDLVWHLNAIHNLTVAINQLHTTRIYHNDFKPANALVFHDTEKVGDFGRATSPIFPAVHDMLLCAGDRRFAPPEQLYYIENEASGLDPHLRATAGDIYNLGSIIHYIITKRSLTPEIVSRMPDDFRPLNGHGGSCDSYQSALPYWRQAFYSIMNEFYDELHEDWLSNYKFAIDDIRGIVVALCEPDFRKRSDLVDSPVAFSKYRLDRVITYIDLLRKKVMVAQNAR